MCFDDFYIQTNKDLCKSREKLLGLRGVEARGLLALKILLILNLRPKTIFFHCAVSGNACLSKRSGLRWELVNMLAPERR